MKKLFLHHSKKHKQKDQARAQWHPHDQGELHYAVDDIETDHASVTGLQDRDPIHSRGKDVSPSVLKSRTSSSSLAPNSTTGSSSHVPNDMTSSSSHAPNGTAGSSSLAPNTTSGSSSLAPNATSGSSSLAPNATSGSISRAPNSTPGSSSLAASDTAGSSSLAPNATSGSISRAPNGTSGTSSLAASGTAGSSSLAPNGTSGSENRISRTPGINWSDTDDATKRDSGISVSSNMSAVPHGSWCSESDLHTKFDLCRKHPKHEQFIPMNALGVNHMPEHFRKLCWVKLLQLKGVDVVRLTVSNTSDARPDDLGFKGSKDVRFGTGTAFVHSMDRTEVCDCKAGVPGHRCSGVFLVMTASHVVFDDSEAKATTVDFFYDSMDTSTIVRAWGVRVVSVDAERNRSIVECRTHDLGLCQRLTSAQKERNELIEKELESEVGDSQMAVLISHPHGLCKQVTFGHMKEKKMVGVVKKTKDGTQLADCLLTYDTPTCPGAGGGPVNVIGGGTVSYAFAPHCASKGFAENLSGLGWMRVM